VDDSEAPRSGCHHAAAAAGGQRLSIDVARLLNMPSTGAGNVRELDFG
jgi:hypothetical protein